MTDVIEPLYTEKEICQSLECELENLSENERNMIEQLHEAKYSKPTLAEWLAEHDAQLCNIDIDGWKGHLPVPKEWTIDTVMSIIRNAAPKYED